MMHRDSPAGSEHKGWTLDPERQQAAPLEHTSRIHSELCGRRKDAPYLQQRPAGCCQHRAAALLRRRGASGGKANPAAEEARWLVHAADWGYLSALDRGPAASQGAAGALHAATR